MSLADATTPAPEGRALNSTPEVVRASPPAVRVVEPTAYPEVPPLMGEIPAAAAASVAEELPSPVMVEVIMVVLAAEPLTAPEALSRTESALAPLVGEGEAEARASVQIVSHCDGMEECNRGFSLTLAVLGAEGDDGGGLAGTASLVGAVTDTVAEVGLPAVAEDVTLTAAEGRGRNAKHVVDAGHLK